MLHLAGEGVSQPGEVGHTKMAASGRKVGGSVDIPSCGRGRNASLDPAPCSLSPGASCQAALCLPRPPTPAAPGAAPTQGPFFQHRTLQPSSSLGPGPQQGADMISRTSLPGALGRGGLLGGDGHCWPWGAGAGGGAEPWGFPPSLQPRAIAPAWSSMYSLTCPPPSPRHGPIPRCLSRLGPKPDACENTARGQGTSTTLTARKWGAQHPATPPPLYCCPPSPATYHCSPPPILSPRVMAWSQPYPGAMREKQPVPGWGDCPRPQR